MRVFADASRPGALHAAGEMIARAVEDAERRLHDLRREEWEDGAVAAAAFALAIAASAVRPTLALPLFVGGLFVAGRSVVASLRRSDLLGRLAVERDAYSIAEVRELAEQEARIVNRHKLSRAIRWRLELLEDPRIVANTDQLAALAEELDDPQLELDPACAVACSRLLMEQLSSGALIESVLPPEDIRSRIAQIRFGFHPQASE